MSLKEGLCKGCGAPVYWITTQAGKGMIVDRKAAVVVAVTGIVYRGYPPHWATCPNAEDFKKYRGKNEKG